MPQDNHAVQRDMAIAPRRFLVFLILLVLAVPAGILLLGWRHGVLAGFDLAALVCLR